MKKLFLIIAIILLVSFTALFIQGSSGPCNPGRGISENELCKINAFVAVPAWGLFTLGGYAYCSLIDFDSNVCRTF
jgi:hypothetical protein